MDLFEKINRSFGSWYEGLFGGGDDVRPKDILRRILAAMEDHRKEGFDNKVYVPNQFVLEINVQDEEEKEYLLSFLDRAELESAIRRYCQQNRYHIRGALDFTIKEVEDIDPSGSKRAEKVRVRCRYNTKITGPDLEAVPAGTPAMAASAFPLPPVEERTVASVHAFLDADESGTVPAVASATLVVYAPDRPPYRYAISRGSVNIGRSNSVGNDLVIETDGQISKRHSRIEMDPDGRFTLYDLGSTNGTKVNGRRIDNRTLNDGDEIMVGTTRITFLQKRDESSREETEAPESVAVGATGKGRATGAERNGEYSGSVPPSRILRSRTARLVLMDGEQDVDDFLLASETVIGRGVTNDIVLPDRSIATRHARIIHDGDGYVLECLSDSQTTLNGFPLATNQPTRLEDGYRIVLGNLTLRFEAGTGE